MMMMTEQKVLPESKDLPLSKLLMKICSDILVLMVFESKCSDRFTSRLFMNDMHDMEGVIKAAPWQLMCKL